MLTVGQPYAYNVPTTVPIPANPFPNYWPFPIPANPWYRPPSRRCPGCGRCQECGR